MAKKRAKKTTEVQHEPAQAETSQPDTSNDPRPAHLRAAFVDVGAVDSYPNARAKFAAERAAHLRGETFGVKA